MMKSNIEVSIEIQQKIEFYLIALSFTLSGFAIQTLKPTGSIFLDSMFILSIALILISGIIGVYRMDYVAQLYNAQETIDLQTATYQQFTPSKEDKESYEKNIKIVDSLQDKICKIYNYFRGTFLLGLVILFFSKIALVWI